MQEASGAEDPRTWSLPPLRISVGLIQWGRALVLLGCGLLAVVSLALAAVVRQIPGASWIIAAMIVLSAMPVVIAVLWIVGRALMSSGSSFTWGVTATPLMALTPPPRPPALATPLATLRFLHVAPVLAGVGLLLAVCAVGDVWVSGQSNVAARIGAFAVTSDGLVALAALLLTLGWGTGRLGRALEARERELRARYFAFQPPADESVGGASLVAVCAVPSAE